MVFSVTNELRIRPAAVLFFCDMTSRQTAAVRGRQSADTRTNRQSL